MSLPNKEKVRGKYRCSTLEIKRENNQRCKGNKTNYYKTMQVSVPCWTVVYVCVYIYIHICRVYKNIYIQNV